MSDLDSFLSSILLADDIGEVLCLAYGLPSVLQNYRGGLTYVGLVTPQGPVISRDYTAKIRTTAAGMTLALEQIPVKPSSSYAMVYLDGDHTIGSLVRQINAAVELSDADTLFVLPGAVPPARNMAYAEAVRGQSWWVGEVWTLLSILGKAGATVKTHPTNPLGTLFATNVAKLDYEHAQRIARELQDRTDDEAWSNYFTHTDLTMIENWATELRAGRRRREYIRIVVDPAEPNQESSTIVSEVMRWQRPGPAFIHDLSGLEHDVSKLFDRHRVMHAVKVDEFKDAFLAGRDAILLSSPSPRQLSWYGKNTDHRAATGWMAHIGEEDFSEGDIITSLSTIESAQYLHRSFFENAVELEDPIFLGTPDEHPNYGMWLLYSVPGVRLFQQWKDRYPKYMAPRSNVWQRTMLLALGLRDEELLEHRLDTVYRAPAVATMRQTYRDLALASSDAEAFDAFAEEAVALGNTGPERIFISRLSKTRQGGHRGLRNEEALIEALTPLGFKAVEPERYSLAGQAGLFRSAKVVIGLGGAAMFNVAFCRPGAKVVDIESGLGFVDTHCNLFASRGTDYGIIIGRVDDDHPSPYQKTWTIDVDEVVRVLRIHL